MLWTNLDQVQVMGAELSGLPTGQGILSTLAVYDNTIATGKANLWADAWLIFPSGYTPAADAPIELYKVPLSPDASYEDTTDGASPIVNKNALMGVFDEQATSPNRRSIIGVPYQPYKYKHYLLNLSGTNFPVSSAIKLYIITYSEG